MESEQVSFSPAIAARLDVLRSKDALDIDAVAQECRDELSSLPEADALKVLEDIEKYASAEENKTFTLMKLFQQFNGISHLPQEGKIQELQKRTGCTLIVTGILRKYGGPPPLFEGARPAFECEVLIAKLPATFFEDELVPLIEPYGRIYEIRYVMENTSRHRGYAVVTFFTSEEADACIAAWDKQAPRPGLEPLHVNRHDGTNRLFVGCVPKRFSREEIRDTLSPHIEGIADVIVYRDSDAGLNNRGFCFLEFPTRRLAVLAFRRIASGAYSLGESVITVDWADPQIGPDPEVMKTIKVLYVTNLGLHTTEEAVYKAFSLYGQVERVKKIRTYAYVYFTNRDEAVAAISAMDKTQIEGYPIGVCLARPMDFEKDKKKTRGPFPHYPSFPRGGGDRGRGGYYMPRHHPYEGAPPPSYRGGGRGGYDPSRGRGGWRGSSRGQYSSSSSHYRGSSQPPYYSDHGNYHHPAPNGDERRDYPPRDYGRRDSHQGYGSHGGPSSSSYTDYSSSSYGSNYYGGNQGHGGTPAPYYGTSSSSTPSSSHYPNDRSHYSSGNYQ